MPEPIKGYFSASTFQSADGSNFTTAGFDIKFPQGLSTYIGMGTDFTKDPFGVIDFKESNPYGKGSIVGHNVRIRTKYDDKFLSTQVRVSPCTINVPVGKNTSIYVNPHYVGQYDYQTNTWKNGAGIFAGATQKFGQDVSVSLEGQRYNLQDIGDNSGGNWSINAIVSLRLP
ncbi:hypothetical protein IKP85_01605 [bacterium]|nr:hypothetical protein [bacterium]